MLFVVKATGKLLHYLKENETVLFLFKSEELISISKTTSYRDLGHCGYKEMVPGREQEASVKACSTQEVSSLAHTLSYLHFPICKVGLYTGLDSYGSHNENSPHKASQPSSCRRSCRLQRCLSFQACSNTGFQGSIWNEVWPSDLLWQ